MVLRTIRDIDCKRKRVLVRVDFNVPLHNGKVVDDSRIKATLPTIKYLLGKKAIVILMSHLGRPLGVDESLRLYPVAIHLGKLLGKEVMALDDCVGDEIEQRLAELRPGDIALLENLRFHGEEEENDTGFARALAENAEVYVNDAFGASHRAHASIDAVTRYLPSVAGFLLENEVKMLSRALNPGKPFVLVLGGAKVSDKIGVIETLAKKADYVLIGGAMMFTFLLAKGLQVGKSKVEKNKIGIAKLLMKKFGKKLLLPVDVAVAQKIDSSTATNKRVNELRTNDFGLDIGPETAKSWIPLLRKAKSIVWNGPLGYTENRAFSKGTAAIAKAIAGMKCFKVVGGGDTIAVIQKLGLSKKFTHASTGGGASLEFLEGKTLPGIRALELNFLSRKKMNLLRQSR